MPDDLFPVLCVYQKIDSFGGRTPCKANGRDPGVEGGNVWLQVEWLQIGLGTLLCNEVQLGAVTWLQRVRKEKQGFSGPGDDIV